MRHLAALLVAILVAPISWLLLAFGQDPPGRAFTGAFHPTIFVRPAPSKHAAVRTKMVG